MTGVQTCALPILEYKQASGVKYGCGYKVHSKALWSSVAVRRILTSVVYLGVTEQAKRTTPNYKVKREIQRPQSEWIRVEGTHEPIISQDDFDLVARLLLLDTRSAPGETVVYPLAGLLYCGDCHSSMARKSSITDQQTYHYYICGGYKRDRKSCTTHSVRTIELEQAVLDGINLHIQSVADLRQALEAINRRPAQKLEVSKLNRRMDALQKEVEKARELKDALYRRYAMGEIELEDFREFKRIFEQDCQKAEQAMDAQRAQLDAILKSGSPTSPWIDYFRQFGRVEELTRPIAVKLIDQVLVYEGGRVEIVFRYQAEYEMARQFLSIHTQEHEWKEVV